MRTTQYTVIMICSFFCLLSHNSFAVTSGPAQPETQQFTPVGASDMVDLFSGNFMYNIPLFELPGPNGGYPFNLGYNSGVSMDQEATWVGLGWNLHIGSINRQMRTLPDEFNGTEKIIKKVDQLDNKTIGMGLNFDVELAGASWKDIVSLSPSYGVSMYYNTYKGFGFSTDIGVGVSFGMQNGLTGGIGISVKNDNQEGATFSPNLSLGFRAGIGKGSVGGSINLGLNYNSNMGLQNISLGGGMSVSSGPSKNNAKIQSRKSDSKSKVKRSDTRSGTSFGGSGSASMSFNNSFITSPSIKNNTKTSTFQGFFKLGGVAWGLQMSGAISGNYSNEVVVDKMKPQKYPAFGYLNLQDGQNNDNAALDFIREKDGQLHKDMRNLASPVLTYDIYSVTGQGFSGMFRPYRSDIGSVYDKNMHSTSDGVNVSLDASIGNLFQVGFSLNFPTTDSKSGKWKGITGNINEKYNFTQFQNNSKHEPYRFQVYGESNVTDKSEISNLIGGFEPSYVAISSATNTDKIDYTTLSKLGNRAGQITNINTNSLSQRSPRQTDIKAIENEYLYDTTLLPEFKANYVVANGTEIHQLDRKANAVYKSHHIGAYVVTTTDGTRYIYALPVYNFKQVENSFSVKTSYATKDGLNQLEQSDFQKTSNNEIVHNATNNSTPYGYENYEKTEIPAYVHTWLLTAIIGPDYVDMNEDGLTDDDMGYFVKFTYKKSNETYKWRAPFTTANFIEGQHAIDADNMGTYNYGERESYYLYKAETKSHVAMFYTSNSREDARGATDEFQKGTAVQNLGAKSYKLDSVSLLSKLDLSKPIKKVYFEYNKYNDSDNSRFWVENNGNELCQNVENADHTKEKGTRGKLTLKSVYTIYGENEKGLRNPYIFDYHENVSDENPNYNAFLYDRWGNYQEPQTQDPENPNQMLPIKYFPYTRQDVEVATKNKWAAVWNLKEIILPTGAKITVDYEADRYAYVQNRPAMEMYKINGVNSTSNNTSVQPFDLSIGSYSANENYVTFKLKRPIITENGAPETIKELEKYLDANKQLYYKIFIDLNGDNQWEFITGYADIHSIELVNSTTAKIRLKNIDLKKGKNPQRSEHPFALATWNYVQANRPELLNDNANGPLESRGRTGREVMNIINTFLSALNPLSGLMKFQNFYTRAASEGWGQVIDYDKSYIRLNSYLNEKENTVVEKFGGDSRVQSVKIYESPTSSDVIAGQYYDYTDSIPGTNLFISTGVAANEPSIGGDECALKFGKIGFLEPKFKTNYIQFQEMPMNESYMPAPDVGYSKVTVKSYATQKVLSQQLSATIPTTGVSVNEFYTAKDYPTIYKETTLSQADKTLLAKQPKLAFRPLGGTITESNLGATQGYYTEINDMHGKERKVSYYGISNTGKIIPTAISYVEYLYKSNNLTDGLNGSYKSLNNEVPVIYNHLGVPQNKLVGVDVENFIDTRESETINSSEGGRFNLSVIWCVFFPLPIPTFFPDLGYDQRRAYTCVDNKIIHKFGILEKTKVYKEGALTVTDNLVYDGYTGTPLLTSVNNEFNDTIFNYSVPAHLIYSGVGPSYPTNNLLFTGTATELNETTNQLGIKTPQWSTIRDYIQEGDELIVKDKFVDVTQNTSEESEYDKCYVMKVDEANKLIWVQASNGLASGLSGDAVMYVYRPYNRNILKGTVGTIVSKNNPLRDKQSFDCK